MSLKKLGSPVAVLAQERELYCNSYRTFDYFGGIESHEKKVQYWRARYLFRLS